MGFQAFGTRQGGDRGGQLLKRGGGQLLHGDHLQVIGYGQATALAGGAGGGEHVVGAGSIIPGRLGTEWAHENAAGVLHLGEQAAVGKAEVLRCETVGDLDGALERGDANDG